MFPEWLYLLHDEKQKKKTQNNCEPSESYMLQRTIAKSNKGQKYQLGITNMRISTLLHVYTHLFIYLSGIYF